MYVKEGLVEVIADWFPVIVLILYQRLRGQTEVGSVSDSATLGGKLPH